MTKRKASEPEVELPNPALVPEPTVPAEKTFLVTGPRPIYGHKPGDTFTALLHPDQEAYLVAVGHLTIQTDTKE